MPFAANCAVVGSSPHTRGARVGVAASDGVQGIIPAYAGSTNRRESEWSALWDHPRIRGEHVEGLTLL